MNLFDHPTLFRLVMNLWPPFLGAGIRVVHISKDWRRIVANLCHYGLNRNYMGTHFGGSLFALTDPFYMLMLKKNLGANYQVWDQAGAIEFKRPVRHKVAATFALSQKRLERIRLCTANGDKHYESFVIDVVNKDGLLVAQSKKTIYIRNKPSPLV